MLEPKILGTVKELPTVAPGRPPRTKNPEIVKFINSLSMEEYTCIYELPDSPSPMDRKEFDDAVGIWRQRQYRYPVDVAQRGNRFYVIRTTAPKPMKPKAPVVKKKGKK